MSGWARLLLGVVLFAVLLVGLGFWMDVYGIRRGCLAPRFEQVNYQAAQDLAARANTAMSSRNYAAANDMLDLALVRLGENYQLERAAHDTGEAVAAAKAATARAEFQIAARIKAEVVTRRLALLQRKVHLSELCRDLITNWRL